MELRFESFAETKSFVRKQRKDTKWSARGHFTVVEAQMPVPGANKTLRGLGFAKYNPNDAALVNERGQPALPFDYDRGYQIAFGRAEAEIAKQLWNASRLRIDVATISWDVVNRPAKLAVLVVGASGDCAPEQAEPDPDDVPF